MSQQKRLLTAANSKLGKIDIVRLLDRDEAWILLPQATREHLYSLLPEPKDGEPERDVDIHPLRTGYRMYVQNELRRWQNDLKDGREVKKWRQDAMMASRDRIEGKYDVWKEQQKKQDWSRVDDEENTPPSDTAHTTYCTANDARHDAKTAIEHNDSTIYGASAAHRNDHSMIVVSDGDEESARMEVQVETPHCVHPDRVNEEQDDCLS